MPETPIYIKITTWLATMVPAIVGAAISLKLSTENASFISRLLSFCLGVWLANIVGGAFVDHYHIDTSSMIDDAIILTAGIFGMASASQIYNQLPKVAEQIPEFFKNTLANISSWFGQSKK